MGGAGQRSWVGCAVDWRCWAGGAGLTVVGWRLVAGGAEWVVLGIRSAWLDGRRWMVLPAINFKRPSMAILGGGLAGWPVVV